MAAKKTSEPVEVAPAKPATDDGRASLLADIEGYAEAASE